MNHRIVGPLAGLALACILSSLALPAHAADPPAAVNDGFDSPPSDWPWWRGPKRTGEAEPGQDVPLRWSESENVAWKVEVPGRGHGSPVVVGPRIFLATADDDGSQQAVLCFDRDTGERLWQTVVHASGGMQKNVKSSAASSTVACDGERVFINFPNNGAVYTTALGLDGTQLWQTKITDYEVHQGYGSSPALYQSLVIVSADNKAGGAIVALDRSSGDVAWRHERPATPNYPSPIILHVAGRDQLLMSGCDLVTSLNPLSGEKLWEIEGATTECVTSTVTDSGLIFTTGGYPESHMSAVRADGSGETMWRNRRRVYVPSLLAADGFLYGVMDAGVAACWDPATGEEVWRERLGGDFTASPVLVGDKIFATSETGETFIFRANPKEFESIGTNQLGDQAYATPTICGGRIYIRVAHFDGDERREVLYCLAKLE